LSKRGRGQLRPIHRHFHEVRISFRAARKGRFLGTGQKFFLIKRFFFDYENPRLRRPPGGRRSEENDIPPWPPAFGWLASIPSTANLPLRAWTRCDPAPCANTHSVRCGCTSASARLIIGTGPAPWHALVAAVRNARVVGKRPGLRPWTRASVRCARTAVTPLRRIGRPRGTARPNVGSVLGASASARRPNGVARERRPCVKTDRGYQVALGGRTHPRARAPTPVQFRLSGDGRPPRIVRQNSAIARAHSGQKVMVSRSVSRCSRHMSETRAAHCWQAPACIRSRRR
jgi:hypothetical protein